MNLDADIQGAIDRWAQKLRIPVGSDLHAWPLLAGLCFAESSWGDDRWKAREEAGYMPGGRYHRGDVAVAFRLYGDLACRSWGPWQLMYPVACELGFGGRPWELTGAMVAAEWTVAYLNRRTFTAWSKAPRPELVAPAMTIDQVSDSYNTGSHRDSIINLDHQNRLKYGYGQAWAWLKGNGRTA
jgi:hypothetical protein